MKTIIPLALLLLAAAPVHGVTINFDAGPNGQAVGSDFAADGLLIDQGYYASDPYESTNGSPGWMSGEPVTAYNQIVNASILGRFTVPVNTMGFQTIFADGGGLAHVSVYDSGGGLITTSTFNPNTFPNFSLYVEGSLFASFAIEWERVDPGTAGPADDVVGIDNLSFSFREAQVPDASKTLPLFAAVFAGMGFARRFSPK